MKPFTLTVVAKMDLTDIALFTQRPWGKEQRNVYLKQFDESFWLLAENPDIGKSCNEIRETYRKFPQSSHVIFINKLEASKSKLCAYFIKIWMLTRFWRVTYEK